MKSHHVLPLFFVFLLSAHFAEAQVRFGVKAGVNSANIRLGGFFDPVTRFQGGVMVDIPVAPHFSVQPALLYSGKGYATRYEETDPVSILEGKKFIFETKINYLEVPVLALYRKELTKGLQFFGGLGPYVGIGINGELTNNIEGAENEPISFSKKSPRSLNYERFDLGVSAAIGLEYRNFMLGLNYNYGLRPVPIPSDAYNRTLGLTAGYLFGRGK